MAKFWSAVLALALLSQVDESRAALVFWPTGGIITYVRTYTIGNSVLRAEIGVSGGEHNCGNQNNIYYFDSDKSNVEVVKSVVALAFGAMVAGKPTQFTYDCSLSGGGYGWGFAISVFN